MEGEWVMMFRTIAIAALLAFATTASAQATRMIQPLKMPTAPAATAAAPIEAHTAEMEAKAELSALKRENARLQAENADLKAQLDGYRVLGGSQVHAYCAAGSNTVSKNTAGAESNCANAGYTCEPVSGQCRNSCQTSDMCAGGFTCDTGIQQCVRTG
jgi:hypothetical protein